MHIHGPELEINLDASPTHGTVVDHRGNCQEKRNKDERT